MTSWTSWCQSRLLLSTTLNLLAPHRGINSDLFNYYSVGAITATLRAQCFLQNCNTIETAYGGNKQEGHHSKLSPSSNLSNNRERTFPIRQKSFPLRGSSAQRTDYFLRLISPSFFTISMFSKFRTIPTSFFRSGK